MTGGGTEAQIEGLGTYLESIGVAFQIIDDVLNLRGFKGNTKHRGEDIVAGKITYPVAKAMTRLDAAERARIWGIIKSKPQDQKVVEAVCDDLVWWRLHSLL
jgi:geranylgeranyl pyrophosphate synthase